MFHFAGGNSYSFRFMTKYLTNFSVISLELPGRGNRVNEDFKKDLNSAAQDLYSQILGKLNNDNFVIYGHSMGALLGLKVSSMLEQINRCPSYLFVSGHEGPLRIKPKRKRYLLKDEELIEELKNLKGIPLEVIGNEDFLSYYLPIFRADFEVTENDTNYEFLNKTPIFAMMGDIEKNSEKITNWKIFTHSNFTFQTFKGGHFFIYDYPEEIANIIQDNYYKL